MEYTDSDGNPVYIPRGATGLPTLRVEEQERPRVQAPPAQISPALKRMTTAPITKDEATSLSQQATGSMGLTSKYSRARDPNETIKALLQLQELMPPGLKKQKAFTKAMEGGLGGILGAFKGSPASALDLRGLGTGIDQLFGTNTAQILQPTTHNLAMSIPKLAEMVEKSRSKYSQAEQSFLNKILSDFDTTSTKGSTQETGSYKQMLDIAKKQSGMSAAGKSAEGFKISDRAGKFVKDNVDYMTLGSFDKLDKLFEKYKGKPSPLNRSEAMNMLKTGGYAISEFFGKTPYEAERIIQNDREAMQASYELLTGKISMLINKGALSEEDIRRANRAMGRNWATGGDTTRRSIISDLRQAWENSFEKRFDTLDPRVKDYLQKRGTKRSFFKSKDIKPEATKKTTDEDMLD